MAWLRQQFAQTANAFSSQLPSRPEPMAILQVSGRDAGNAQRLGGQSAGAGGSLFDAAWERDGSPIEFGGTIDSVYPTLEPGMAVTMPQSNRKLKVVALAGEGYRAKVYQAVDLSNSQNVALKIIHEPSELNLVSIAAEGIKADVLESNSVPCARILEIGRDYALKQWIAGTLGDDWLARERQSGQPVLDATGAKALFDFYIQASRQRVIIENLKPANMMLTPENVWIPFDPGRITVGSPPREVLNYYRGNFIRKWLGVKPYSLHYAIATCMSFIRH
jgi:hypothetical protein